MEWPELVWSGSLGGRNSYISASHTPSLAPLDMQIFYSGGDSRPMMERNRPRFYQSRALRVRRIIAATVHQQKWPRRIYSGCKFHLFLTRPQPNQPATTGHKSSKPRSTGPGGGCWRAREKGHN